VEYTINKLAQLAGVTTRTLRHYDEIGLLTPRRTSSNGYRIYGSAEVDRLQQILFFREMGMPLDEIGRLLASKGFDGTAALESHLKTLQARKAQLDRLIGTVQRTLAAAKGETTMQDSEKFDGFKRDLVANNEAEFGAEVREMYGDEVVEKSNAQWMGMTQQQYDEMQQIAGELSRALQAAVGKGDPAGAEGQAIAELHKRWLGSAWGTYSKEAHIGVTQMYVDDERFARYYNDITPGAAEYLRDAVKHYCA
jgi:DNA-binding transcriptional MerR regulator